MDKKTLLKLAEKAGEIYSDGETSVSECIDLYCANELSNEIYNTWFINEAMLHGIPKSVAENKTKLSDHFSKEYIEWKCNKG